MTATLTLVIEIYLMCMMLLSILLSIRKNTVLILTFPATAILMIAAFSGYTKSAYHLLIICTILASTTSQWTEGSKKLAKISLQFCLLATGISALIHADWSLHNKNNAPQLYAIWGLITVTATTPLANFIARIMMFGDILTSLQSLARGVLIGSSAALGLSFIKPRRIATIIPIIGILIFAIYVFAMPILLTIGKSATLENSASNAQRALMNYHALMDSRMFSMNETAIFESAESLQYPHDDDRLTVHNLILAFSLFNGIAPATALFACTIFILKKISLGKLLPLGFYLYLLIILGPDSSHTRISLLLLGSLSIISPLKAGGDR